MELKFDEDKFKKNPEEFIAKASSVISKEIAKIVIQEIKYDKLDEHYTSEAFNYQTIRGRTNENVLKVEKYLYYYIKYDSKIEKEFAKNLEAGREVLVYVKLPSAFYIETPVGKCNPDWVIVFDESKVKHIFFIAETKGSSEDINLRFIEDSKIACAKKHFEAISSKKVRFVVVDSYVELMEIVS